MKQLLIITLIFIGMVNVYGAGNTEKTADEYFPVVTGGWHEMDKISFNETILNFAIDYLTVNNSHIATEQISTTWFVERIWTQLVQGRRYLLAYNYRLRITNEDDLPIDIIRPNIGLLMLRRDFDGTITLEKDYKNSEFLDFIGILLTGERNEKSKKE